MAKKTDATLPQPQEQQRAVARSNEPIVGLPKIDQEDLILPKIILMQGLSKWVQEQKAKAGEYVNSLTARVLEDTVFVPAAMTKHYVGLRHEGTKSIVEFRTNDKFDDRLNGRSFFNDKETKTKANALSILNCIGLFGGKPFMVSFSKTSYKTGRKLLNILASANRPIYELRYKLTSSKETNDSGTFYVMDIEQIGESTEEEKNAAQAFQESFLPHLEHMNGKEEKTEEVPL